MALAAPALADQKIKVGISGGDAEILWAKVKEIAAEDGLEISVVVFNDYLLPNAALDAGDLDANAVPAQAVSRKPDQEQGLQDHAGRRYHRRTDRALFP
jgi:ABC-type metal ion transport system substrate-binding protein